MGSIRKIVQHAGFKFVAQCKVCSSKDKYGNTLRDEVDALRASGWSYEALGKWLIERGIYVSVAAMQNHYKKHAPYAKKGTLPGKKTGHMVTVMQKNNTSSDEAIRKIVQIGDTMIDNWLHNKKGPQMPVTQKLFIEALHEEGRRAPKTSIDVAFEDMEKDLIEGEEVVPND